MILAPDTSGNEATRLAAFACHGAFYFDLIDTLLKRLVFGLANDLGKSGLTAAAVAPGFMRTEAILEGFGVTEASWRDALSNPAGGWGGSETPCFVSRAVAALAADPHVGRKNEGIFTTRALSQEYGFTELDGTTRDYAVLEAAFEQAKETYLAPLVEAGRFAKVDWKLASKTDVPSWVGQFRDMLAKKITAQIERHRRLAPAGDLMLCQTSACLAWLVAAAKQFWAAGLMWAKSFRERFCEHTGCAPDQFEQRVLRHALHRRSLPLALLIRALHPQYFDLELQTLRYLGNSESTSEFRAELDSYRSEYRRKGGVLRNAFAVRLSGRRLMVILAQLGPELQVRRPNWKIATSGRDAEWTLQDAGTALGMLEAYSNPARH